MSAPFNFSLLTQAGVTQAQFGALVGVSRVTVNLWTKGHSKPNKKIAPKVKTALAKIETAINRRVLPVADENHAVRTQRILDAMVARG